MDQLDLLASGAPRFPRARRSDPTSSHQATGAIERTGRADAQLRATLAALEARPGRTSAELAGYARLDRYAIARRLPELLELGKVRRSEPGPQTVPCAVSGKRVCRWWPV